MHFSFVFIEKEKEKRQVFMHYLVLNRFMVDVAQKLNDKIKFLEANVKKAGGAEKARMEEELVVLRGIVESRLTKTDEETVARIKARINGLQKALELIEGK